jgi:hypothetical protein
VGLNDSIDCLLVWFTSLFSEFLVELVSIDDVKGEFDGLLLAFDRLLLAIDREFRAFDRLFRDE